MCFTWKYFNYNISIKSRRKVENININIKVPTSKRKFYYFFLKPSLNIIDDWYLFHNLYDFIISDNSEFSIRVETLTSSSGVSEVQRIKMKRIAFTIHTICFKYQIFKFVKDGFNLLVAVKSQRVFSHHDPHQVWSSDYKGKVSKNIISKVNGCS